MSPRSALIAHLAAALAFARCTPSTAPADDAGIDATLDAADAQLDRASSDAPIVCNPPPPTSCGDPPVHYGDIEPILATRCVAGCHDGADAAGPWPLTTFANVASWSIEIRTQLAHCEMPPVDSGLTLSDDERFAIMRWVACGSPL
jgi:hypothetical protein